MDELDHQIVRLLKENGRKKFLEMAKETGASEATVRNRVRSLEDDRVILGYSALVDPRKLGYDAVAFIGLNVDSLKFFKVVEALARLEDLEYLATGTGEYMIVIEVWKKNQEEITKFISEKISVIDGIMKISPTIVLEKIGVKKQEEEGGGK